MFHQTSRSAICWISFGRRRSLWRQVFLGTFTTCHVVAFVIATRLYKGFAEIPSAEGLPDNHLSSDGKCEGNGDAAPKMPLSQYHSADRCADSSSPESLALSSLNLKPRQDGDFHPRAESICLVLDGSLRKVPRTRASSAGPMRRAAVQCRQDVLNRAEGEEAGPPGNQALNR